MTSIAKLKDRARKHEHKEDWKAAIEAYQKVLEAEEGQDELELELGLFNRVGDLYLRLGQTDQAVSYYEMAADKYAESGFYNNAIALCNKALRHRPDRPQIYLKLSRLCIEQGFLPDARRWILEFAERQVKAGKVDEALTGLEEFAGATDDPDVRELLARHLAKHDRAAEAVVQLRKAHQSYTQQGNDEAAARVADRARELDPDADLAASGAPADPYDFASGVMEPAAEAQGLGLETHRHDEPTPAAASSLEGLEATRAEEAAEEEDAAAEEAGETEVAGLEATHVEAPPPGDAAGVGGLETFAAAPDADEELLDAPGEGVEGVPDAGLEPEPDEEPAEPLPLLDTGYQDEPEEDPEPLPLLDPSGEVDDEAWPEAEEEIAAAPSPEAEEERAAAPFGGPVGAGDTAVDEPLEAPGEELGEELGDEFGEEPAKADDAYDADDPLAAAKKYGIEPVDLNLADLSFGPSGTGLEAAEAGGDLDVDAVLTRARELVSRALTSEALKELRLLSGAEASPEVYRNALGVANEIVRHDANDITALQARVEFAAAAQDDELLVGTYLDLADALARLGSETKSQAMYERVLDLDPGNEAAREALGTPEEDEDPAIDLDAILREIEPEAGSGGTPAPSSDPAFAAMLSQLRSRAADQEESEDAGDHYDLGLAFKEMGLIDEAIAEFQTALTAGEERLKVYEELGQCFVLKRQFTVALKIFKRALQMPHEDETELLGVYYLLGQCHEELGQRAEAREAYEKVLAIDDSFGDVPTRVARL